MTKEQYICRRAANAILSEIGPYQISSDALQTINQFLDQILVLLLQNTQSLEPALVKSQLLALLPHGLGKNALVEAELEVKTYSETSNTHYLLYHESINEPTPFPLHQAWTSLRYRCIEHSTLTEKSLDSPTRSSIDNDLQGMVLSPVVIIYFTSILEHVAEYILTIIANTAERDGVRYIRIKEVYSALVNDGQVGGLFKQTDLQSKLEKRVSSYQSQQQPPYQTFSLPSPSSSPAISFKNQVSVNGNIDHQVLDLGYDHDDDLHSEPLSSTYSRTSSSIKSGESASEYRSVSALSNATSSSNRSSSSSKRTFRFFGKKAKRPNPQEQRTKSPPPSQPPLIHDANTPALDFEDLMRSGNTIKVSLTPNRLRSIEIKSSPTHAHQPKKSGLFNSSAPSTPISSPTLSHPTPLRAYPPTGTPFENPRAAPKPPIGYYQPKSFETPPLTPDSSIASRLSTTRSPSPSFEEDQQPPSPPPQQQQRTNARYTKHSVAPLQLSGRSPQHRHRKQESIDTLSTDVCAMDLPSPPSTMDHHPSTLFSNNGSTGDYVLPNKPTYDRPSSMVAKRAASGIARPVSCHENFAMTMGQQHVFKYGNTTTVDSRKKSPSIVRSASSSLSRPSSPSVMVDPTYARTRRRSTTRPSSPAIVEEEEEAEDGARKRNQSTTVKALDAGTDGNQVSQLDTTWGMATTTMVNSSMQTDPLPGLAPLASILPLTKNHAPPIPTLIVTADDQQQQPVDIMRRIRTEQGLDDDDDDDDDDEEWFLEDDDWDDIQGQDSVMAEWLLGET